MVRTGKLTSTSDPQEFLGRARAAVNAVFERWIPRIEADPGGEAAAAIAYSLRGPGKRLRPALALAVYEGAGAPGRPDEIAAAIEVVHTYSLVHDDLPCMDNDDLRRGRPTTHRAFGTKVATRAGYLMVPLAARMLAAGGDALALPVARRRAIARTLFSAAGVTGMIGGQVLDLEAEGRDLTTHTLQEVHRAKTGALITASVLIGGLAARVDDAVLDALRSYGDEIGLAFQIVDDVLDATASSTVLGKTAGKDARQRKATYAALLGPEAAMAEASRRVERAIDRAGASGIDSKLLSGIAEFIVTRPA